MACKKQGLCPHQFPSRRKESLLLFNALFVLTLPPTRYNAVVGLVSQYGKFHGIELRRFQLWRSDMLKCKNLLFVLGVFSALLITPLHYAGAQESKVSPDQVRAQSCKDAVRQQLLQETPPGYLVMLNSVSLLPPSPAPDSAAQALDNAISEQKLGLRGTPRWTMATEDADLQFPHAAGTFSCALNAPITECDTPHLYRLIYRMLDDASHATAAAKKCYHRDRPFVVNGKPTCTPNDEEALRKNGSYPSGHTTIGWAWALILSEIAPDRIDAILARGVAFGQSRVVCNVHWESDVIAGYQVGAALVARLHADPAFIADLTAAKAELAAVRAKGLKPTRDCVAEAKAYWLDGIDDDITSLRGGGAGVNR
jgi:acid phosphatase (class A)